MKRKIVYTDEPMGRLKVIHNFLPPPDQLVFKEDGVKVTLSLSRRTVDFFKAQAAKHHTPYQRMIRRLLDLYAEHNMPVDGTERKPRRARSG